MARIRTIKPEMPGSASLALVSRDARLLFVWLITDADDVGRVAGSAKRLAGQLYPHDDDVAPVDVDRWLKELVDVGVVRAYFVGGARYLELVGWAEHQKIHKPTPSRIPDPCSDHVSRQVRDESAEDSRTAHGEVTECPRPTTHARALVHGPRSMVEGTNPDEVNYAGKSLSRPQDGSAPRLRQGEPAPLTTSLAGLLGRMG